MTDNPPAAELSPTQIQNGIARLKRRMSDLENFNPEAFPAPRADEVKTLELSIEETLIRVFGPNSREFQRYEWAARLQSNITTGANSREAVIASRHSAKRNALNLLQLAIQSLEEDLLFTHEAKLGTVPATRSNDVFIVHGRDSPAKTEVARLVERAGLDAVILHEQPNQGRTIIEKFEDHGSIAGFAVILLTPDDVGGLNEDQLQPRARQNVIGEMFWFAGKLGRDHVCALKKGEIEMPSDFAGIGYVDMDDRGTWKMELLKELQAAGYTTLDWAKALS
jgi:predicted nucleotide-binding protein